MKISPENTDQSLLILNGFIEGGQLHFSLNYPKAVFRPESVAKLAAAFKQSLEALIRHCQTQTESQATPSDFPLAKLTQEELDVLNTQDLDDLYPQTPVQQGMVFHSLYNPDDYITQMDWCLEGELNQEAFQHAWNALLMQFDILRTSFHHSLNGKPIQCLHHALSIPWTFHDWQQLSSEEQQQAFAQLRTKDQHQAFDLEQAPLMRLCLVQETPNCYRLLWTSHHLLLDGWSMPLLYRQLMLNYETLSQGKPAPANKAKPYSDYVAWLMQQDQEKARLFWQDTLADKHPTRLPFAKAHTRTLGQQASLHWQAPVALSEQIIELGQREGLTSNTIVQGLWALLLSHYSNSKDVLIGVTVSGRNADLPGIDEQVGLFINSLPLALEVKPKQSVLDFLHDVQQRAAALGQFEYSALSDIQTWTGIAPLFEQLFVFENYPLDAINQYQQEQDSEKGLHVIDVTAHEQPNYALNIVAHFSDKQLTIDLRYNQAIYQQEDLERLLNHYENLLASTLTQPLSKASTRSWLSQAEQQQLLVDWNNTIFDYPKEQTLQALFEAQVEKNPDATALVFEGQTLSYRELNTKANQLAHYLVGQGIKPDSLVALCLERSLEMVIAILGILKAGAAYLPLDPENPPERLHSILDNAKPSCLFCLDSLQSVLAPLFAGKIITLSQMKELLTQEKNKNNLKHKQPASTMCYTIFTSGSTGTPKGVANIHSAVVNRLLWMKGYNKVTEHDVILQKTPYTFDVSVWEFFLPLISGSTLVIAKPNGHKDPNYLAELINQQGITLLHFVPSMLAAFLNESAISLTPEIKRRIVVSGEALTQEVNNRLFAKLNAELHNFYGPTEAAVDVSFYTCEPQQKNYSVPIGKPIWNTQLYILDEQLIPCGIGIPGELYITGVGLARGYLNRPDLTAERFIANPFSTEPGARMYKTGDLCRYLADGNIEYLGRLDHQVKIRGFRIELGEIEAQLTTTSCS